MQILKTFFIEDLRLVVIGIVLGLAGTLALTRPLASLLLGVGTADPFTFASVTIILVAVALLACWIPARRAAKVDPMVALRNE
jgi:putative ABC transport system permease protein